jgi:SHS2 domain-containing protein
MEQFKFLEHTADMKFQAFGKSLEEAFSNSAVAMFNVLTDTKLIEPKITKSITTNAPDLKSLLYNFLEELLFLIDTEFFILNSVSDLRINNMNSKYLLTAVVIGDKIDEKYSIHGDIKAITYNEMEVKEEKDYFMVQVVVDV